MRVERGADDRGWSVPGAAALPLWERTGPGGQGAVGKRRAGRLGGGGGERGRLRAGVSPGAAVAEGGRSRPETSRVGERQGCLGRDGRESLELHGDPAAGVELMPALFVAWKPVWKAKGKKCEWPERERVLLAES